MGVVERGEGRAGRDGRQEDAAEEVHVVGRPGDLGQRVFHAVDEDLDDAGAPARLCETEVGHPAVVGLDAGPPSLVVGLVRGQRHQVALLEEGGDRVGEEDLGHDPVGLVLGQSSLGVPVAVADRGEEVGEGDLVRGGPGVELVVEPRGQIRPVVDDVGPAVRVG